MDYRPLCAKYLRLNNLQKNRAPQIVPFCLPSQMGEHGVICWNMETMKNTKNMKKMENIDQMT